MHKGPLRCNSNVHPGGPLYSCFLLGLIFSFAAQAVGGVREDPSAPHDPPLDSRPNIIFLLTDDQRADTLSVAGHPIVKTPHIDALAHGGIRYTQAFTVQPICAPSRFAFLSGQYERTSGLGFNSPYLVNEAQWASTYPALLRDDGYFTGFIGKFGVQFYEFEGGAAGQFDYWRGHDGWLPFFPKDLPENPATQSYAGAERTITTEIMGEMIADFLDKRPKQKPFLLSVSFSAPHNSVVSTMFPEGASPDCDSYACRVMAYPANQNPRLRGHPVYDGLYRDQSLRPSDDTGKNPFRFIPEGVIDHDARKKWYEYNYFPDLQPEHLVRYYQTVSGVDQVVGQLRATLADQGVDQNTIVIFSSDHGLLNGEYGTGGKALLYDLVTKIPLIVFDPRKPQGEHGVVNDDLVLSIDVPATILSVAGVAIPDVMEGHSLTDSTQSRDEVFLESLTVAEGNPFIEALRTDRWKYVRYFEAQGCPYREEQLDFSGRAPVFEQLFDLQADPGERHNLIDDPAHAQVSVLLRERTHRLSQEKTSKGRRHKQSVSVASRPASGSYCW